jgi:hypothetical protein
MSPNIFIGYQYHVGILLKRRLVDIFQLAPLQNAERAGTRSALLELADCVTK